MTVLTSQFPDITAPGRPVHELVLDAAQRWPDSLALVDAVTGERLTYEELADATRRTAAVFVQSGLRPGAVVAVLSPNSVRYPVVFHGAALAGLTVTTLNALYTAKDIAYQLGDSGAVVLLTARPLLEQARAGAAAAGIPVWLIEEVDGTADGVDLSLAAAAAAAEPLVEGPEVSLDSLAVLPYSSGTTGLPKGVMLTHRNLVANLTQGNALLAHDEEEVLLAVLPFFHIYGMQVLMNGGLAFGATVVTMPRFDLATYLRALQDHRVTRAYVAPPIVVALAKHPSVEGHDLSALRFVFSGAAPLDAELAALASQRLGVPVAQGYGMTELSPLTHATPYGTDGVAGSIGKLVPSTEALVVDPLSGDPVPPGERGELWVRGPQVMQGYLNNAEATAATIDADGWLHTGDVAEVDDDGNYYVVDRIKELIKYKGYQVAPAELEAELLTHPGIADAAVIGVMLEGEEVPKAYVVRAPSAPELSESEVIGYLEGRVAPHKRVRLVEFLDAVPKSASGKILRRELRARG